MIDELISSARTAYDAGDYAVAISHASNALVLAKTDKKSLPPEAFSLMGAACMRRGNAKDAVGLFRRCIYIEPTNARYQASLCAALREVDEIDESVVAGQNSLRFDPYNVDYMLNTAESHKIAGNHAEAQTLLRCAVAQDPSFPDAHIALGENLLLQGEWEAGWRERAMDTAPYGI